MMLVHVRDCHEAESRTETRSEETREYGSRATKAMRDSRTVREQSRRRQWRVYSMIIKEDCREAEMRRGASLWS